VGLELVRENAIEHLQKVCGPQNSLTAKNQAPSSIRAMFGKDSLRNAVHCSDSLQAYEHESRVFFSVNRTTALLNNCTCAVIKPHVLHSYNLGKLLD
jgi:nucleoside-diphosphate kinase